MLRFFYQYEVTAKDKNGDFGAVVAQHEDPEQDLQQILDLIRRQVKVKLDAKGWRDMAVAFKPEDIKDIRKVIDYRLDVSAGDTSVEITIKLYCKSIYFKTEGVVTVSINKTLRHKVDSHHCPVWHISR